MQEALTEIEDRNQENIQQIRHDYDIQKKSLEEKMQRDKDQATKRYNILIEESEEKLRNEVESKEGEIEGLQD
jgi:hypothetical protein